MFEIVALENCPHSIRAVRFFEQHQEWPHVVKWVNAQTKVKYQKKTSAMNTFPQISVVEGRKKILLGGTEVLYDIVRIMGMSY